MPGAVPSVGHNSDYLCLSSTVVWTLTCLDFLDILEIVEPRKPGIPSQLPPVCWGAWGILPLPGTQVPPLSTGYLGQSSGGHTPE